MAKAKCDWCGKTRIKWSGYEQKVLGAGEYKPICSTCYRRMTSNQTAANWSAFITGRREIKEVK